MSTFSDSFLIGMREAMADDRIALEAKLDAILRCLTCPECGGSGFVYSRAEFGTSTVPQVGRPDLQIPWVRPPQSSPCPCRAAARRLLDGEAE